MNDMTHGMAKWMGTGFAAALLLVATSGMALAGDVGKELSTAIDHADYSMNSKQTKMVHLHLHHVLNCLEGPGGKQFDANVLNPCKGQGEGILKDLSDHHGVRMKLEQARDLAAVAVHIGAYVPSKRVAEAVHALLQEAKKEYMK